MHNCLSGEEILGSKAFFNLVVKGTTMELLKTEARIQIKIEAHFFNKGGDLIIVAISQGKLWTSLDILKSKLVLFLLKQIMRLSRAE